VEFAFYSIVNHINMVQQNPDFPLNGPVEVLKVLVLAYVCSETELLHDLIQSSHVTVYYIDLTKVTCWSKLASVNLKMKSCYIIY